MLCFFMCRCFHDLTCINPHRFFVNRYNHKSDIWSLGCVLYELTTLKHAFDARDMKGLVLKILRGIYPPVSDRYSPELRNLIAEMLRRNPRDRPSINAILRKPVFLRRIEKFLSAEQISSEFAHTVLHRQSPFQPQPAVARASVASAAAVVPTAVAQAPPAAKPVPSAAAAQQQQQQQLPPKAQQQAPPSSAAAAIAHAQKEREAARIRELERRRKEALARESVAAPPRVPVNPTPVMQQRPASALPAGPSAAALLAAQRQQELLKQQIAQREAEQEARRKALIQQQQQRREAEAKAREAEADQRRQLLLQQQEAQRARAREAKEAQERKEMELAEARKRQFLEMREAAERNRRAVALSEAGPTPQQQQSYYQPAAAQQMQQALPPPPPPVIRSRAAVVDVAAERERKEREAAEERRKAFMQMREEALRNKRSIDEQVGRGSAMPPPPARSVSASVDDARERVLKDRETQREQDRVRHEQELEAIRRENFQRRQAALQAAQQQHTAAQQQQQQPVSQQQLQPPQQQQQIRGQTPSPTPVASAHVTPSGVMAPVSNAPPAPPVIASVAVPTAPSVVVVPTPVVSGEDLSTEQREFNASQSRRDYADMMGQMRALLEHQNDQQQSSDDDADDGVNQDGDEDEDEEATPEGGGVSKPADAHAAAKFKLLGATLRLDHVTEHDSVAHRVESLRVFLEKMIGDDLFLKAYRILDAMTEQDDEDALTERVIALLGAQKKVYLPLINQMIVCEDLFYDRAR
eukprot:TRINITY_DN1230_c0_g1_i1.p1 TRINITY_DN1230_c0_g1~~TRINITY_DN1230_c0_g1_i1.p1  ORF type:complete len:754 (+),score=250.80 TRINITY_DN1230_c0_g1_i1:558-2819(+)